ncbi:MAG: hypothetical protein AAGI15_02835 [Pseudomonadota bacterium]
MAVNPPLSSGVQGLERALSQFDAAAARIAGARSSTDAAGRSDATDQAPAPERPAPAAEPGSAEQVEALASLQLYAREVQAASKVIETADATVGFLLDTRA